MIRKHVDVRVPPARAFAVWTERVDQWWPPAHRRSGEVPGVLRLDPHVGGALAEHLPDGTVLPYGEVLAWEPPHRLTLAFFLGGGPAAPSHVEVTFTDLAPGTRVSVVHTRGELGDRFDGIAHRFDANWSDLHTAFAQAIADEESP